MEKDSFDIIFRIWNWLFCGFFISVILLSIPKRAYVYMSRIWNFFTPNFLTVVRLPFVYVGMYLFFCTDREFFGYLLILIGTLIDRLDGKHATALEEAIKAGEKNLPKGKTDLGAWLDPLVDKLAFIPLFLAFTLEGVLTVWMFVFMFCFEFMGVLIRPPFMLLNKYVRTSTATGIGKVKVLFMSLTILVSAPYSLKWVESNYWIPHLFFGFSTFFAGLSILSRFSFDRKLEEKIDFLTNLFSHSDS